MRRCGWIPLAAAILAGLLGPAAAAPRLELAPSGGVLWLDPALGLGGSPGASFGAGVHLVEVSPLTFTAQVQGTRFEAVPARRRGRALVGSASFGIVGSLRPGARLQPYLGLAAGWAEDASTDARGALGGPLAEASLGLAWRASGAFRLRLEAREGRTSQVSGEPATLVRLRSVQLQLVVVPQGWKASMAEPAGARQAVPRTTTAARADARGGRDTDRDGAADGIDRCPGTPAGAPVDARGCPSDSDADGVLDGIDRCAGTPLGSPVDAHGCPIAAAERRLAGEGRLRLACECSAGDPVFAPAASAELDVVARLLERRPTLRVEVGAHTDGRGTTERNRAASLRCAQRVVDAVRARHPGLAADRFVLRGFGEEQPLAPNDTEAGRAQNRRVEVVLLEAVAPVR